MVIDIRKRSNAPNQVKPVENINKNPQSFSEISLVQKEHTLLYINCKAMYMSKRILSELTEYNPSQRNCSN